MKTSICRWEDGLALRLPASVVQEAGLSEGAEVDVRAQGGQVIVARAGSAPNLEALLARFRPEHRRGETDRGEPAGEEIR